MTNDERSPNDEYRKNLFVIRAWSFLGHWSLVIGHFPAMTAFKKNLMVGITVLVALILLGWMLQRFSDVPVRLFTKKQMPISLDAPSAEGVVEGTSIYYLGV